MNRLLEEPELFTVRADGQIHGIVLVYNAETARALRIKGDRVCEDGRVEVGYRLGEPAPTKKGAKAASRN